MPTKTKQQDEDMVEYKVAEFMASAPETMEEELNRLATDGWRVIAAVQGMV